MTDIDPKAVMAAHEKHDEYLCTADVDYEGNNHCLPYRLAEMLANGQALRDVRSIETLEFAEAIENGADW